MNYQDMGLIKMSYSDRFDDLYTQCVKALPFTKSNNTGKAQTVLNNIKQDLSKLQARGDMVLTDRYKTSLVPHLESMYREIKYFS